ncbi:DUF2252 domain-containing protein [Aureimonas psammosilenae]|uniref:DUF2252 domain-containing protein n=1 Tax=Aureimonas psammosilenae TaxID=2495496 RepID=UPI00126050B7|nr:DUF2252 domain-containing protein [Aureimonas psammosilenae]
MALDDLSDDVEAAEALVLEPLADFPHIDLRTPGEPWEKRRAAGKVLREAVPHSAHGPSEPIRKRPDPVRLIERAHKGRQADLVPLRVARMASSPFAFLRGTAHVMAWDLAQMPNTGIDVVLDGDAHIANFGLFGTPQGDMVLDLNDFDEVTIGPWEWDLKRLVASIVVAARASKAHRGERRAAVEAAVTGYRQTVADLAPLGSIEVWGRMALATDLNFAGVSMDEASRAIIEKAVQKARRRNNRSLLDQIVERQVNGGWRFRQDAPILTRVDEETRQAVTTGLEHYADTLPRERRFMLNRYHVVDVAHRVVGVGSVGTRAYVAMLCGNSDLDVLFLQVKEAVTPALAPYVPGMPAPYNDHEGERVIYGQRLLQAVGDPLLGWTSIAGRPFYVRQMKNMKGDIPASCMSGRPLQFFAYAYGALLARAHARTGDAAAISGYCGGNHNTTFANALTDWAESYADQNEADHSRLVEAIEEGRLTAAADPCL